MAESIKVAVRVRPTNAREIDLGDDDIVVSMKDETTTLCHERIGKDPKHFTFDYSYMSMDSSDPAFKSQEDVFLDIGKAILTNAMNGFNGTLFTYGQTGSGKSYTVMGPPDDAGIIPRTVCNLFHWNTDSEANDREVQIRISYLEIYKEKITDLLCQKEAADQDLKIMDHPKLGVYVRGLEEIACSETKDVMANLQYGIKKRVVACTNMNAQSSRSHSVFTIHLRILDGPRPEGKKKDDRKTLNSKVNLIDLAGSERSSKAQTSGERLKEGSAINQSLSALGICIKTLCESKKADAAGKANSSPVPFRMSKLTFLLKDSLAGNSKTFMMATISPASDNVEETLGTLRFASSVKTIQTVAIVNKDKKDQMIENMEEEIRALKAQYEAGGLTGDATVMIAERERLKDELQKDFKEELNTAREMQTARDKALESNGLSPVHITEAFGIGKGTPYLLNMADDPMLAGCLIYLIKETEETRIGAHQDNTINLKGVGIPDFLCTIKNSGNTKATLERVSALEAGRIVVNGKLVREVGIPEDLHNGYNIFLGRAYALKLIMPADSSPDSSAAGGVNGVNDLSLEGLEDEYAALDDSASWNSLVDYADQVLLQMPSGSRRTLTKEMKKACQFCDEANELTAECRDNGDLEAQHFEVDLTSAMPACVVVRVLWTSEGRHCQDEEAWHTKYLWTVGQLVERVGAMRDYCASFKTHGFIKFDPIEDPWVETDQVEIAQMAARIRSLEVVAEEARARDNAQEVKKLRTMMSVFAGGWLGETAMKQFFLRSWNLVVSETKFSKMSKMSDRLKTIERKKRTSTSSSVNSVRDSPQMGPSWSATSEKDKSPFEEKPAPLPNRPARRMTIKSSRKEEPPAQKEPTAEEKRETMRKKTKQALHRQVTICSEVSENEGKPDCEPEPESSFGGGSPLQLPQAAEDAVRLAETAKENDMLRRELLECRRELEESRAEKLADKSRAKEEHEGLKRQLEVAWELCGILRDYAKQLLEGGSADAAGAVSTPKALAEDLSSPSRELLSPSTPPPEWSSVTTSPQTAWTSVLPAIEAEPLTLEEASEGKTKAQAAYFSAVSEIAAAIAEARGASPSQPTSARDLRRPLPVLPVVQAVLPTPGSASPLQTAPPTWLPPAAVVPTMPSYTRPITPYSPASPSSPLVPTVSPLQAALGGQMRRIATSPPQYIDMGASGSTSPGRPSSRSQSADRHVATMLASPQARSASVERHMMSPLPGAHSPPPGSGSSLRQPSPPPALLGLVPSSPAANSTAIGTNTTRIPLPAAQYIVELPARGPISSGSLPGSRAPSADRQPMAAAQFTGSVPAGCVSPGNSLSAMWGGAPGVARIPYSPSVDTYSRQLLVEQAWRGDTVLMQRPVTVPADPADDVVSAPTESESTLPLQDRGARGRLSMLEEQVRLIAERVGSSLPAQVNEGQNAQDESAQLEGALPVQVIDTARYKAPPDVARSRLSPADQANEPLY